MSDQVMSVAPPQVASERGLVGRVLGVLTSPRHTYTELAARPRWLGLALVVLLCSIVPSTILLSTQVGQRALLDQQMQAIEAFGGQLNDAQYQRMQQFIPYTPYFTGVYIAVLLPIAAVVVSGLMLGIFSGLLEGRATFVQVFTIVVGSGLVLALRNVFSAPLDYARGTLSSPSTLSAALPFFEDNTFAARLLGAIDLFVIWWIVNLAIGLAVLYKRRTSPIATTMICVYVAIGLAIAIVRSLLSGA